MNSRKNTASSMREQVKQHKKKQIIALLEGMAIGFCICLLIFAIGKLISIVTDSGSGKGEYTSLQEYVLADAATSSDGTRIDFASLCEINSETVGWIEIPDTKISYPLVQTSDNSYYLSHTFSGTENSSGCIFVETSNSASFTDLHTILYGHNMKNGSMFGTLKKYKKQSYYEEHPYIYIDLEDGTHCYAIFSCYEADATDIAYTVGYTQNDTYQAFLDSLLVSSLYSTGVDVEVTDQVITLSTITSSGSGRFVVHANLLY